MDVELDVEQLQKACRAFPVVAELLKYNLHLSVSALAKEMREKLISFDGNHTRAQAKLCDRIASLEDRAKQAVAGLHNRVKELESQDASRTLAQGKIMETQVDFLERIKALEASEARRATAMEPAEVAK